MYTSIFKKTINFIMITVLLFCIVVPVERDEAAMAKGSKWVGNIIAGSVPSNYSTYWNQVTPENASKWGSVEGSRDNMNWNNVDLIYNYAKSNGIPFKFHTLVWGNQEPSWIGSISAADQKAEVLEWIQAAGKKYGDSEFVDVVNEPLHAPASYRNALGGSGSTGWDWIVWAFEQARQAFPNSKLLINDYGIISDPNAANNYVKIINILKSKGLVDGVGIQCHQFNMDTVSTSTMKNVLNILGATGLPIYVSELDMTGDDTTQLNRYKEKFPVLYESQYVKGITLWGYQYKATWIDNTWLTNSNGGERPALTWLKQYLAGASPAPTSTPKTNTPTTKPTSTPTQTSPVNSTGDLNKDGVINMSDLMILATSFGSVRAESRYVLENDLNNDGAINMSDVLIIATNFNKILSKPESTPVPSTKVITKVMPLGDSITDGLTVPGGYRIKLWENIASHGFEVDFLGSMSNGPTELGDKNHEGHSGWRIDQIDEKINSWMDTYKPQIVLLHIGTNDVFQKYDLNNAPARLSTLIDKICAKLPSGGKIYVASIIPLSNADVKNYNAQIPSIVQNKVNQGKPVYMVDMYNALTISDLADGVHPNATGYNKMADVWYNAIKSDLH